MIQTKVNYNTNKKTKKHKARELAELYFLVFVEFSCFKGFYFECLFYDPKDFGKLSATKRMASSVSAIPMQPSVLDVCGSRPDLSLPALM